MSELKKRISNGEGLHLDFKFRIDDQRKIGRTLVAFANSEGGSLLVGVKDSGKIAGCNPEEEFYMIEGAANVFCNPPVNFDTQVIQEGHLLIMEVIVATSETKHKAQDDKGAWKMYHRIDDHTLLANKITFLLWRYKKEGRDRPESFTLQLVELLEIIKEHQPVSISKLYRFSSLSKRDVNEHVATLVYWKVLRMDIAESGIKYFLAGE